MMIRAILRRAEAAQHSGDLAEMIRCYREMTDVE
jgi:hypothetical protein